MNAEERLKPYLDEIASLKDDEIVQYLKGKRTSEDFALLVHYCCDIVLDNIQLSYYNYTIESIKEAPIFKIYCDIVSLSKESDAPYFHAVAAFFTGKREKTLKLVKTALPKLIEENPNFDDFTLAVCFIGPFKGAFPGFWNFIRESLSKYPVKEGVLELCDAVPLIYTSDSYDQILEALNKVLEMNPDGTVAREFMAYIYYQQGMWGNALALFEQIENDASVFLPGDIYFWMGWCYGKLKETASEIEYYEKAAEINPAGVFLMNNLGYAYYRAKQYQKALKAFQECMDNGWELKYAVNNYVRTLLAMKRYKDAKEFVKNPPSKVSKSLLEKVKKAGNTNAPVKEDEIVILPEIHEELPGDTGVENKEIELGVKKQQFTSEKLLEEELVLRMNAGMEVFGRHLKLYRRKGIYGQQYILSNGKRPDLLAEDAEGNLYVIELKKDSGYSDAYSQITEYLDWFDKNWKDKVKDIHGIICLNNPSQELLDRVHENNRVRVFEYQISYTER